MELRQLRYLIAIQEAGSYAAAAAAMNISPPAITLSIGKLEKELGVRLFERGRRGAIPTPAGEALINRARIAQAELNLGALEVDSIKGARRGNVTVGAGPHFVDHVIPSAIAAFHKKHPKVSISIVTGPSADLFTGLRAGELDFVVSTPTTHELASPDLDREVLFATRDVVVVRAEHPLAQRRDKVTMSDLIAFPWILSVRSVELRDQVLALISEAGLENLPTLVRTDSASIIRGLLMSGNYIAALSPERNILGVGPGRIVKLSVDGIRVDRKAAISYRRRGKLSAAADAFAQDVKSASRRWRKLDW